MGPSEPQTVSIDVPEPEILAETQSVCPECLKLLQATVVSLDDTVYLEKSCPTHGFWQTPLWRGEPAYQDWRRPKAPSHPEVCYAPVKDGCPFDCGLCEEHRQHPCSVLLEVTQSCSLGCPVCFADVGTPRLATAPDPDLETIATWYDRALAAAGPCNIQLSGGEPTHREDLPEIIRLGIEKGFSFIQLNTNGLRLASDPGYAKTLAEAGLSTVFLQFDGTEDRIHGALRGRPLAQKKIQAIENCGAAGLGVVLVPTLVPGVNTDNIGAIIDFALGRLPVVRGIHFQPVSHFGRYTGVASKRERITLPEVMRAIEEQTDGLMKVNDFVPPGGENARCSFHGSFFLLPDGRLRRTSPSLESCLASVDGSDLPSSCCCAPQETQNGMLRTIGSVARQWAAAPGGNLEARTKPTLKEAARASSAASGAAQANAGKTGAGKEGSLCTSDGVLDLDAFLERAANYSLTVSCMAFQDAWNLDLERLHDCCISIMSPDGRLIPFCAYNLTGSTGQSLYRGQQGARK